MGWFRETDAEHQARYDRMKAAQGRSEDRRQSLQRQARGMSGHPASETKRRGFHEMSDHELQAHGMIRVRGLFGGVTYRTMESHQDKVEEAREARYEKQQQRKRDAQDRRDAKKAARGGGFFSFSSPKKPAKRRGKGFFYWE